MTRIHFFHHDDPTPTCELKFVRFPPHSPLPIAALPSMSLPPKAPFPRSPRRPSFYACHDLASATAGRSSRSLHSHFFLLTFPASFFLLNSHFLLLNSLRLRRFPRQAVVRSHEGLATHIARRSGASLRSGLSQTRGVT